MKRRRRLWFVFGGVLLAVAMVAHFAVQQVTDPERLRALAESYLRQFVSREASVASASFSWFDGIHLYDVHIYDDSDQQRPVSSGTGEAAMPQFSAPEIRITPNLLSTLTGNLVIESVVALGPTCNIVRDAATGRTNLSGLVRRVASMRRSADSSAWPSMELRDARLHVYDRDGGVEHPVDDLTLTIRGSLSQRDSRYYDLVWLSGRPRAVDGHAQIDLASGRLENIRGGLPWMSIEAVMIAINAKYDAAGTWVDLLGLDGRVRATDFNFGGKGGASRRFATVELRNARLSIPISEDERSLPIGERYLQFNRVHGTARLTADGVNADFGGSFHGSACRVSLNLRTAVRKPATLDDVDFEVRMSAKDLRLPGASLDEMRFIGRWPRLARFFRDYDPRGTIDVELEAGKKAGRESPVSVRRIVLQPRDVTASWRLLPYRLRVTEGAVEVSPGRTEILNLIGTRAGGRVRVNGTMEQPERGWPGRVTVAGESIPIDDALQAALPERFRAIRPLLHPDGDLDVTLTMTRPTSDGPDKAPWDVGATIRFDDLTARYEQFPYPLDHLSGAVAFHKNRVALNGVAGLAGQAPVSIEGVVGLAPKGPQELHIRIAATDVALDELLREALPASSGERFAELAPSGRFDLVTELKGDPATGKPIHTSKLLLKDASFQHALFPGRLEHMHGNMTIDATAIRFTDVTGKMGDGDVTIRGSLDYATERPAVDLAVSCQGPGTIDTLLSALPERLSGPLARVTVEGPADAVLHFGRAPEQELSISGFARLDGVSVRHPRLPIPLQRVTGRIDFDAAGIKANGVKATYQNADLRLDIETRHDASGERGILKIDADNLTLDETVRAVLPESLRRSWDRLGLGGRVDLSIHRLDFQPAATGDRRQWTVVGEAMLHDVSLSHLNDVRHLTGTLAGDGLLVDRSGGTALNGTLMFEAVEFAGQPIESLTGSWSYARRADGRGLMTVDLQGGRLYEGLLTGKLKVALEPPDAGYDASITVKGLDITSSPAARDAGQSGGDAMKVRGLADLSLYLSGRFGDPLSKRGGGRVEISNGQMYRLPIMRAILNVIDLTVPDDNAFHDVAADFFIVGNRVQLNDIVLRGDLLALAGSGTMTWPDQGLDLSLVHVSPYRWARLPVLSGLVEGTTRTFVELHLTGPLFQPTVTARPLPSVSDEFKQLFRKKVAKKTEPAER